MLFIEDIRRRYTRIHEALEILSTDEAAKHYALAKVRDAEYGLPVVDNSLMALPEMSKDENSIREDLKETFDSSLPLFNRDQENIFNAIIDEFLPDVTAKIPFGPVKQGILNCEKSRV